MLLFLIIPFHQYNKSQRSSTITLLGYRHTTRQEGTGWLRKLIDVDVRRGEFTKKMKQIGDMGRCSVTGGGKDGCGE